MKPKFIIVSVVFLLGIVILLATRNNKAVPRNDADNSAQSDIELPTPNESTKAPKTLQLDTIQQGFESRRQQQRAKARNSKVLHDFGFEETYERSGITFVHHAVDDAGKYYKPVHYDHGNGVAVADVNGDGLLDIYFTSQLGRNELWRNQGDGSFEDITESAAVGLGERISVGASFADTDNDGDADLFVTTVKMGNVFFENLGNSTFKEISKDSGLNYSGHSSGAVFFDFNRDGLLDLFLTNVGQYTTDKKGRGGYYIGFQDGFSGHTFPERTENSILYRNLGNNRFEDVSDAMNLQHPGWSGDATICDVNRDGWPDLYVLSMQGDDIYYQNMEGKSFEDKTAQYFPKTPWGAMGVSFFDFNRDGISDILVTDMHSDMTKGQTIKSKTDVSDSFEALKSEPWCSVEYTEEYLRGGDNNIFGNSFYVSQPDGTYSELSDSTNAETFWPWGVSAGDLNADGYEDVFVTAGMGFGYRYGINSVLLNDYGQKFLTAEYLLGVEPRASDMKQAFILECSGVDSDHPYCAGQTGDVPILEARSSRSSVLADFDDDGDLDMVVLDMNDRPQFLRSNLSDNHDIHYLKVRLRGTISNRDGLGATVSVTTGNETQFRYCDGKSGYLSQSSLPLYFGLGPATSIARIEVKWPSGTTQVITDGLDLNSEIEVIETDP